MTTTVDLAFDDITIDDLVAMPERALDDLQFGVVGIDRGGIARIYNASESRLAGLAPGAVIGLPFFDVVAQCMNNFMVAQRFEDSEDVDEVVPFVLTLRMRPTPVRLRLLASRAAAMRYVLIER